MVAKLVLALMGLLSESSLWQHQKNAIENIQEMISNGQNRGLIKHPTGGGKTTLFCSVIKALELKSLVLVPRSGLLTQVFQTLLKVGTEEKHIFVYNEFSRHNIATQLGRNTEKKIFILTYQGLLALFRNNKDFFNSFKQSINLIVADEGHTALGKKTQQALETEEIEDAELIGEILNDFKSLELFVTATPFLVHKNVQEIYGLPIIDYLTYEDLARRGILIIPQIISSGKAIVNIESHEKFDENRVNYDMIKERFVMDDGQSVTKANLDIYYSLFIKNNKYLPGVALCSSIQNCDDFANYAREHYGLRVERCTGANKAFEEGLSLDEAKKLLEQNKVDIITTVDKASLGWDVPTLRAMIVQTPIRSSAKYIQAVGRIARILSVTQEKLYPLKSRENTYIIEPVWEIIPYSVPQDSEEIEIKGKRVKSEDEDTSKKKPNIGLFHGASHFLEQGEWSPNLVEEYFGSEFLDNLPRKFLFKEEWITRLQKIFTPDGLIKMTSAELSQWKEPRTNMTLQAIASLLSIGGNVTRQHLPKLKLADLLFPGNTEVLKALTIAQWKKNDWIKHLKTIVSPEMILNMSSAELIEWKDPFSGFGFIAIATVLGLTGYPSITMKMKFAIGHVLYPNNKAIKEEFENLNRQKDFETWSKEQWIAYLQSLFTAEKLLKMSFEEAHSWKDEYTELGLYAISNKVGVIGDPSNKSLPRIRMAKILYPEDLIVQKTLKFATFEKKDWLKHFKEVLSVDTLLKMTKSESKSWRDKETGLGLTPLSTKIGFKSNPTISFKGRLDLMIYVYPEDEIVIKAHKVANWSRQELINHLRTVLSVEMLSSMTFNEASVWRDKYTGYSLKELTTKLDIKNISLTNDSRAEIAHAIFSETQKVCSI